VDRLNAASSENSTKHRLVRAEAEKKAFGIFTLLNDKVLKLVALLVEKGRVDRSEFVGLVDQG
jgi:hypothetical protein